MRGWLFLFCIFPLCLHAVPFYQDPSPEHAYEWLLEKGVDHTTDHTEEEDWTFVLDVTSTFIAQILKIHPEYAETFSADFYRFSPSEKLIFAHAFSMAGIKDERVETEGITPKTSLAQLEHLEFKSGDEFALIIASYLATGDEVFLSQPMAFLNSKLEWLLWSYAWNLAYEWNEGQKVVINFNPAVFSSDLIGQDELPDKAKLNWSLKNGLDFILRLGAWTCLDHIKKEDPTAEKKIAQLCTSDPRLDYQGTLETHIE